jgi:hypothetical protein
MSCICRDGGLDADAMETVRACFGAARCRFGDGARLGCRADPAAASEIVRDVKTLIDNTQLDLVDVLTSPLHVADEDSVFRSPTFYLVFVGVAGLWAGSFALDQTMRSHGPVKVSGLAATWRW